MKPAVHLQTKFGYDFYKQVWTDFETAKANGDTGGLKVDLWIQRQKIERDLISFLDDDTMSKQHKMDDEDCAGWDFYKQISDQYSVLNYFYTRN